MNTSFEMTDDLYADFDRYCDVFEIEDDEVAVAFGAFLTLRTGIEVADPEEL